VVSLKATSPNICSPLFQIAKKGDKLWAMWLMAFPEKVNVYKIELDS